MRTPLEVRYASVPCGGRVAFGVAGAGPGYLMMPGHVSLSDFSNAPWVEDTFSAIADTHRFVTYDHLGGGLSSRDVRDYSLEGLCAEIEAVVEASGCERVAIFTCSTDTPTAIRYSAKRPDRVSALIIANGWPRGADRARVNQSRALLDAVISDWEIASRAVARMWMNWSDADADRVYEFVHNATDLPTYREYTESMWTHDASPHLESVAAPTLVLYTPNPYMPVEVPQEMVARIPDARLQFVGKTTSLRALFEASRTFIGGLEESSPAAPDGEEACAPLSARETEVLQHLVTGASNATIAQSLSLSTRTVERHVQNIYAKLNAHNRVEAANWAREHGVN
jgi:DNA-binding CsgD family transcriptional regulator/pimeloyl-ACP methyl ester carboxylesterase